MVVLALICLLTFAFSLAALTISESQQNSVLRHGWNTLSNSTRSDFQKAGNCCGFSNSSASSTHPPCNSVR